MSNKRLVRNTNDEMIGGVCSGIAHYLNIDPVIVRLVFVLLALGWRAWHSGLSDSVGSDAHR